MRKLTTEIIEKIRESPTLIGKLAEFTGLRTATIELYLRTGKTRRLSTPPVEQFIRLRLKLPREAEVITEDDSN